MIPTIETIVEDLAAGKITKQQAIKWLRQHAEDAGFDLRDTFALAALPGCVQRAGGYTQPAQWAAEESYRQADEMLRVRAA